MFKTVLLLGAIALLLAACGGELAPGLPSGIAEPGNAASPNSARSSQEGDLADHYFHHPFTTSDTLLEHAIQLALADEQVQEMIAGRRHAVVDAFLIDEDKYRPCSATYRCVFLLFNYGFGSLGAAVDLEKVELWDISGRTMPAFPAAIVGRDEAKKIALDYFQQVREQEADIEGSYVKGLLNSGQTVCAYHGCCAVVLFTPDGHAELVAVDRIEATVVETIKRPVEDRE